jgi:hypothetical protein
MTTGPQPQPKPDWYSEPNRDGWERYWDGSQWTLKTRRRTAGAIIGMGPWQDFKRAPIWVQLGAPALVVAAVAWFLAGSPDWDNELPSADPSLKVECFQEPNQAPRCVQGYSQTEVEPVEEGDACGDDSIWTETYYAPLIELRLTTNANSVSGTLRKNARQLIPSIEAFISYGDRRS